MRLQNKFPITTNKFYIIEGTDGEYVNTYHGSISDYQYKISGIPSITYAGKARATLQRLLKEAQTALTAYKKEEDTFNKNELMLAHWANKITQCENALEDLKSYAAYDLVGIVESGNTGKKFSEEQREFLITHHKLVMAKIKNVQGITFREVTRTEYEKTITDKTREEQQLLEEEDASFDSIKVYFYCTFAFVISMLIFLGPYVTFLIFMLLMVLANYLFFEQL